MILVMNINIKDTFESLAKGKIALQLGIKVCPNS